MMEYYFSAGRCRLSAFLLCLALSNFWLSSVLSLDDDSLIFKIQDLKAAFVSIQSENAAIAAGPDAYVKDNQLLMVFKRLGVARYNRQGGGVIIDSAGIIVTNAHIVEQAARVKVILTDNTDVSAQPVFVSREDDLAFLRIELKNPVIPVVLAPAESMHLGNTVYTVGSSEILKGSISEGRITGLGTKDINQGNTTEKSLEYLKINFNVYQGDSGSALIDREGRLIGLVVAGSAKENVALAIPATKIRKYYLEYLERMF